MNTEMPGYRRWATPLDLHHTFSIDNVVDLC
jgi:hypothetical protein